ncbi:MAG: T9SS type A sorting domain-containing protein [Bacteroidota bacterium]
MSLIFLVVSANCKAQSWEWARDITGVWQVFEVDGIADVDAQGNSYLLARQEDNVFYGEEEIPLTTLVQEGIQYFLLKLDESGEIVWQRTLETEIASLGQFTNMAVGPQGEVYLTGSYGALPIPGAENWVIDDLVFPTPNDTREAFVLKLDQNGIAEWVTTFAELGPNLAIEGEYILEVSPDGTYLILSGSYANTTLAIGGEEFTLPYDLTTAEGQIFVSKLITTDGQVDWISGGYGSDLIDFIEDIQINQSDEIFVQGIFSGDTAHFGNTFVVNEDANGFFGADAFYAKFSSEGAPVWSVTTGTELRDVGNKMIATSTGGLIVCGNLLADTEIEGVIMEAPGTYFVNYNFEGAAANVQKLSSGVVGGLVKSNTNEFILTGSFTDETFELGDFELNNESGGIGTSDIYIARISEQGSVLSAERFGGFDNEELIDATLTSNGSLILYGSYTSLDLPLGDFTLQNEEFPGNELFHASRNLALSSSDEIEVYPLEIFPNPATDRVIVDIPVGTSPDQLLSVFDMMGKKVHEQRVNQVGKKEVELSALPNGVYNLVLNEVEATFSTKLVVAR